MNEMTLREALQSHDAPYPYPPSAPYPPPAPESNDPQQHPPAPPYQPESHGDSAGDDGMSPQSGKGKRELSTSKRAAQNRAAQRAFRQRKEGYIKKLEEQVKDFTGMEQNYRALQNENYHLREYIINLQNRLLETSSELPPPPSHINFGPGAPPAPPMSGPPPDSSSVTNQQARRDMDLSARQEQHPHDGITQLQAAAAQASEIRQHESPYGLGGSYQHSRGKANEAGGSMGDAKPGQS